MASRPSMLVMNVSVEGSPATTFEFAGTKVDIGSDPGCHLLLADAAVAERHARLVRRDGRLVVIDLESEEGTRLNGARLRHSRIVREGDILGIGPYLIEVLQCRPVGERERAFLAAIQRSPADDDTRAVYCDWLEEQGRTDAADFLRAQLDLKGMAPDTARFHELAARIEELAPLMDLDWRRTVARPPIEKCEIRFELVCPKRWDALEPTEVAGQRFCGSCQKNVHYAPTVDDARRLALAGHCVAVDLVERRSPGDLDTPPPRPPMAGMIAPPPRPSAIPPR